MDDIERAQREAASSAQATAHAAMQFALAARIWRRESVRILGRSSWIARFDENASPFAVPVSRHRGEVIR